MLTVEEGEGVYTVTAAAHERNKYDIIEDSSFTFGLARLHSLLKNQTQSQTCSLEEVLYEEGDKVLQKIAGQLAAIGSRQRI